MIERLRLIVEGRVQGVFYRRFIADKAAELALKGWVRNLQDGNVEILAEGERASLEDIIQHCQKGPPGAKVGQVKREWLKATHDLTTFRVIYP